MGYRSANTEDLQAATMTPETGTKSQEGPPTAVFDPDAFIPTPHANDEENSSRSEDDNLLDVDDLEDIEFLIDEIEDQIAPLVASS